MLLYLSHGSTFNSDIKIHKLPEAYRIYTSTIFCIVKCTPAISFKVFTIVKHSLSESGYHWSDWDEKGWREVKEKALLNGIIPPFSRQFFDAIS